MGLFDNVPLALEGQWHGAAAVSLVLTGVIIFFGTIYVLLVAVYGLRQAFHVTMAATAAFMIILSATWVFGIPGTVPGTGPRGTEPSWVMFLPDTEQGAEFGSETRTFGQFVSATRAAVERRKRLNDAIEKRNEKKKPGEQLEPLVTPCQERIQAGGWMEICTEDLAPGKITAAGELDSIKNLLRPALAGYFQRQKNNSSAKPEDYEFEVPGVTADTVEIPNAIAGIYPNGNVLQLDPEAEPNWLIQRKARKLIEPPRTAHRLLIGIAMPRTPKHPSIDVFGFHDKGRVYQPAAMFLAVSIILFGFHLFMLSRFERKQKIREAELARPVSERVPAGTSS
jgi:hypothetical protein